MLNGGLGERTRVDRGGFGFGPFAAAAATERRLRWPFGEDSGPDPARRLQANDNAAVRLLDTTMLYAPCSGGVKRYLHTKRAWMARARPQVSHALLVPGRIDGDDGAGLHTLFCAPLPFGNGYRWPASRLNWAERIEELRPSLIEAGDPFTPGRAALDAGDKLGVPVIGFGHTDLGALAALHLGDWASRPAERSWAKVYGRFDRVVAPSRYIADRLGEVGVDRVDVLPLGVDVSTFDPRRGDREALRRRLGLAPDRKLLVFAGRPAREKRIDVLVEAAERLGDPYTLLLVGAGQGAPASAANNVIDLPFERDPAGLATILAGCDAFVHANDAEPFGLIVLEAMACGLPVVGVGSGGVAETVDDTVGRLARASTGEAMAEAIRSVFDGDREQLALAARRKAVTCFSWDSVFERMSRLYAEVSGQPLFAEAQRLAAH